LTTSQISEETSLVNFDIDSLKLIELGLRLEKEFGDQVALDEWIEQETQRESNAFFVSSLITFIQQTVN
jgi:acyl carrier protein